MTMQGHPHRDVFDRLVDAVGTPTVPDDMPWADLSRRAGETDREWLDRTHPLEYTHPAVGLLPHRCPNCAMRAPCDWRTFVLGLLAQTGVS